MLALGHLLIGNYKVWITTPVFSLDPLHSQALELPYYEVLLSSLKEDNHFYQDPTKEQYLDLKLNERNPLFHPRDKENLSAEEKEFGVEFQSYYNRRDQIMPLIKLSARHIAELLNILYFREEMICIFKQEET